MKMETLPVAAAFSGLSVFFVILRFCVRYMLIRSVGYDDYMVFLSLVFAIASLIMLTFEVHYGLGKPQEELHPKEIARQFLFLWLSIPLYNLSLTFTKSSILLLYMRIFSVRRFILMSRIALSVISVYGLWCVLSSILNCIPVNAFWDTSIQGSCIPRSFLWFFNAAINIVTDLGILIMPIPVLSHLQISWKRKFGLMLLFAVGSFACITSMIRLKAVAVAINATDLTRNLAPIATWSYIEMNMGIICSCLPPLHPLFRCALSWQLRSGFQPRSSGRPLTLERECSATAAPHQEPELHSSEITTMQEHVSEGRLSRDTEALPDIDIPCQSAYNNRYY